jgi:NitT/TauT family transport system ATP-binding protein
LLRIWGEARKTVVFVTHNIGEAVFLSDRMVVMGINPGQILTTVEIRLPRPRTISCTKEPTYLEAVFSAREYLGLEH